MDDLVNLPWQRMDWGFGNPNKTAALIAMLLCAVWIIPYMHKRGFWISLGLFTGLGACLDITQSRGGLVAAIAGGAIILAWAPVPYPRRRVAAVIVAGVSLVLFSFFIHPESHLTKGTLLPDRSINNRLLIWEQVPSMIRAAPGGWGLGKSGDAYMQWFQSVNRGEGYRTLVNSHFTWLVELGWFGRILYLAFWMAILVILWPSKTRRWCSVPLAIWVVFAICSFFSSVAESALLWLVPIVALASVLISRARHGSWPSLAAWLSGGVAVLSVVVAFLLLETLTPGPGIHDDAGLVTLGPRPAHIWVISPDQNILGEHYGHEIRRAFASSAVLQREGIGVSPDARFIPQNSVLVFSGRMPAALAAVHSGQVIVIDPAPVKKESLDDAASAPPVIVVVGEYSKNREYWADQAKARHLSLRIVPGAEDYIGTFMSEISNALIKK